MFSSKIEIYFWTTLPFATWRKRNFSVFFFAPFTKAKFSTSLFKQLKKLHFQRLPSSGPKADKSSIKKLLFIYWTQYKNYYASTIPRSPTTKAANFKGTSCVKTINEEPTGPLGSICPNRLMASMFWDSSSYVYYRYELCMFYIPFLGPLRPLVPPLVDPSVRPCQTVPSGYPNPTRYPVFLSIPDPIQF